jgi:hypothetical protein
MKHLGGKRGRGVKIKVVEKANESKLYKII